MKADLERMTDKTKREEFPTDVCNWERR